MLMVVEMEAILQHTVRSCSSVPSESMNPPKKDRTLEVSAVRAVNEPWSGLCECQCKVSHLSNEEKGEIVSDIAMSMAVCRAGAVATEMTLYSRLQTCRKAHRHVRDTASFNVINGGSHAGNTRHVRSSQCGRQERAASKRL